MNLPHTYDSTLEFAERQLERKYTLPERTNRTAPEVKHDAEAGDAESQFLLGSMHEEGYGVPQDEDSAYAWFRKAALQGHGEANFAIFRMIDAGYSPGTEDRGIAPLDRFIRHLTVLLHRKKWSCLKRAAVRGLVDAQYLYGISTPEGKPARRRFLARAAGQGHLEALMEMYRDSEGNDVWKTAIYRLKKAAQAGLPKAQGMLGFYHLSGYHVKRDIRKGFDWLGKAAIQGDGESQAELGFRLLYGRKMPKDEDLAKRYLESAALQGHWPSAFLLTEVLGGKLDESKEEPVPLFPLGPLTNPDDLLRLAQDFLDGTETPKDEGLAVKALRIGSKAGSDHASFRLACLYLEGRGVPLDPDKALSLFSLAEAQKSAMPHQFACCVPARVLLDLRRENPDCPISLEESSSWFEKRAKEGDPACMYVAAWMRFYSIGSGFEYEESRRLLAESAGKGFLPAQAELLSLRWAIMTPEVLEPCMDAVRKAAESGDGHCRLALYPSDAFLAGEDSSGPKVTKWLVLAAESGEPRAWAQLADRILHESNSFGSSIDAALLWLRKLVRLGDASSFAKLGCALLQRFEKRGTRWTMGSFFERIAPIMGTSPLVMSEEERAERFNPVGEEVREAFEESYRRGYRWAAYWLGEMHRIGLGVKRDPAKAASWYEKAAKIGSARLKLGFCLLNGVGVEKDEARAAKLFLEDGSWEARVLLGRMFLEGKGVVHSPLAAARLFRSLPHEDLLHPSSLECSPDSYAAGRIAAKSLADLYRNGIGVGKDEGWAEYWERMSRGEFNEGH